MRTRIATTLALSRSIDQTRRRLIASFRSPARIPANAAAYAAAIRRYREKVLAAVVREGLQPGHSR